ncbi:hypothetical protein LCGC14_0328330 [marine sediment metagenome]|uniref:Uncharacterized protein n=1 Tax=marine sediment metagenome TaxID=412755 RepID=A0A0F9TMW2_9ZZZZ
MFLNRFEHLVRSGKVTIVGRPDGIHVAGASGLDRLRSRFLGIGERHALAGIYHQVNPKAPARMAFVMPADSQCGHQQHC